MKYSSTFSHLTKRACTSVAAVMIFAASGFTVTQAQELVVVSWGGAYSSKSARRLSRPVYGGEPRHHNYQR